MSKHRVQELISKVFITIIICLVLLLTQVTFNSLSKSFAQLGNGDAHHTLLIRPVQFGPLSELSSSQKAASTTKACTLTSNSTRLNGTPQQIEGPYFVDDMPNRSDIRSDTSDGSVQEGIPLRLIIHVYDVNDGSCVPLRGAKVDIWHTDSQGIYSGVKAMGTLKKNFLRGSQITDDKGAVEFSTIYPGWYEGRAIHIHDKVRTFNGTETALEWTSQLYFNNSMNQQVHKQAPYSNHGPPQTTNEEDVVYSGASADGLIQKDSGEKLIVNLTNNDSGYVGEFNIVLNVE
ncbi:MAG: intradiol ring-cleavage dioxygenase [Thaumarchaeota archaeon]|nr:MAG: intradiol ring-cleavage dioxygenase [Nitrososphaerota archaeon]